MSALMRKGAASSSPLKARSKLDGGVMPRASHHTELFYVFMFSIGLNVLRGTFMAVLSVHRQAL